jgi:hypothetical protein
VKKSTLVLLIVGAIISQLFPIQSAQAALVLSGFGDQNWDRISSPGQTQRFTLAIDTDGGPDFNRLFGMQVGFRIRPTAAATGTLSFGSATVPTTNQLFGAYFNNDTQISSPIGGTTVVTIENTPADDLLVTGTKNAFDLTLQSTDALGVFEIYAVPEFTNYFSNDSIEGLNFANELTSTSQGDFYLLGTVTVTAVPEPSSMALIGAVAAVWGGARYRRRRSTARLA